MFVSIGRFEFQTAAPPHPQPHSDPRSHSTSHIRATYPGASPPSARPRTSILESRSSSRAVSSTPKWPQWPPMQAKGVDIYVMSCECKCKMEKDSMKAPPGRVRHVRSAQLRSPIKCATYLGQDTFPGLCGDKGPYRSHHITYRQTHTVG